MAVFDKVLSVIMVCFWGPLGALSMLLMFLKRPKAFFSWNIIENLPQCARDPRLGEHLSVVIDSINNQKLRIKYVSNGKKDGPLIFMLHGFPECWYSWRFQLKDEKLKQNYRLVAVDLPGYGDSDKPKGQENYHADVLVDNLVAVIRALGYEKAVICSHDWGGVLAFRLADRYPEICERVIVMNAPTISGLLKKVKNSWKQLRASWYIFFFQLPILPELMLSSGNFAMLNLVLRKNMKKNKDVTVEDVDVYRYSFRHWGARKAAVNYYRQVFKDLNNKPSSATSHLKPNILLIWGTEDNALTLDLAISIAAQDKNIKLELVHGASHFVAVDSPDEVNKLIHSFLSLKSTDSTRRHI